MGYLNRFFELRRRPKNHFDVSVGDILMIRGRYNIVTGYGIYDNQVWTEKLYEDGFNFVASGYENVQGLQKVTDSSITEPILKKYKRDITKHFYKYYSEIYEPRTLELYIEQFN